jgi:dTDP-4-amino-4,6-dideoxygalactose transaminase
LALIRNHGEAVVGPASYQNITNIAGFNFRLTELQAAIAREQLKKLEGLNCHRLELVEGLSGRLRGHAFLCPPTGREGCKSTYYVYPIRFDPAKVDITREQFVSAVNAEGAKFYQGYVEPLYLQPLYQKQQLLKHGFPFSAPENRDHNGRYDRGTCPVTESLYYQKMIINEHVRWPQSKQDIDDLVYAIEKVTG